MAPRRQLPTNMYADVPVSEWRRRFDSAATLEERYRAFTALSTLLSAQEFLRLAIATLSDRVGDLRAAAAHGIAGRLERLSVSVADLGDDLQTKLHAGLQDPDPDVRLGILRALAAGPGFDAAAERVLDDLIVAADGQPPALVSLADLCRRIPGAAVRHLDELRQWLLADLAELREAASGALLTTGPAISTALPELLIAIDDEEPLVREQAAHGLGMCQPISDDIRRALELATQDEDPGVAQAARQARQPGSTAAQ
jgi:HEAT repeat protein